MTSDRGLSLWEVPRLWPDGECFIVGGGPSVKHIDVDALKGRRVIAVNMAYKLGNWMDVLFFGDCRWLKDNTKDLLSFAGLKITTCEQHRGKLGIKVVRRRNSPPGLSSDPKTVIWNLSSGACAINLAAHFGVKRIVLLGYDMKSREKEHHWHNYYQSARSGKRYDPYTRFMKQFPSIAEALKKRKIECVNACEDSALKVFPVVRPEDVL